MLKFGVFDFLSDETAPGPIDQLTSAIGRVARKGKDKASDFAHSQTGREVGGAVKTGVTIGIGVGAFILVVRTVGAVADLAFGRGE